MPTGPRRQKRSPARSSKAPKPKRAGKSGRHRTKPDELALRVGTTVKALRREKNFTFDAFVEEVGLGRGYVSELERGLVVPTTTSLAKIATALEVTIADLVLGESERERLYGITRQLSSSLIRELMESAERLASKRVTSER